MEDDIFTRLEKSAFRARFKLSAKDRAYAEQKGPAELRRHAKDFIAKRLAPAVIPNDGRQTPMRKWHGVKPGVELSAEQQRYAVSLIMEWLRRQIEK